jgi:hypothetical protein
VSDATANRRPVFDASVDLEVQHDPEREMGVSEHLRPESNTPDYDLFRSVTPMSDITARG